jgi:anaerobic selenocysteine-containing dehydrogenase
MTNWQPTACILCSRNCGLSVQTEDGHLVKIRGDKQHPISAGYLCQKATRLDHYQNHADRLSQPLRRTAAGNFEAVSWDTAITEIASKLLALRGTHGNRCLAYYGGGGQGNHMGAMYAGAFRKAMGIPNYYSALAQEKTGDFWVNGKLFGRQTCHITEDIEHADCVMFIGTNPWQAHGIRNARNALKQVAKDPMRTMIVVDPRRTRTAKMADIHLQLRPGTDAFLLSAMLAIIVRENLQDTQFLDEHTRGFSALREVLMEVPVDDYIACSGLEQDAVRAAVLCLATAERAAVRVDLGIQQSLNSTLNSYLEKLLFLITGNLGKKGGNNFHSFFMPLIGHSEARGKNHPLPKTAITGVAEIAGLFPPNVLPAEIDTDHPARTRALIVDSANPAVSGADTQAFRRAFDKLELLVVIDVAMTETARQAHYVLPAASQFEKWEATFFNLDFPVNGFHLRKPLFKPFAGTLPEPEIYRRLAVAAGLIPEAFPLLSAAARMHRRWPGLGIYRYMLGMALAMRPGLRRVIPFVLHDTLGQTLPGGAAAAAPFWGASHLYVRRHAAAVARTGLKGRGAQLAERLFERIMNDHSGTLLSVHRYEDTWSFIRHADGRVHLQVPEMLDALRALRDQRRDEQKDYPLVLIAGERRTYNANTLYRDPSWRKGDPEGALRIHPRDAERFGLGDGVRATCESGRGSVTVRVKVCDSMRAGVVSLPHGYGLDYPDTNGERKAHGPLINLLTDAKHCDPISATPFHKYVPVRLRVCVENP